MMIQWEYHTEISQKWLAPDDLASLGLIGWEMVSFQVVLTNTGALNYYVFKRAFDAMTAKMLNEATSDQSFTPTANTAPA